jgi:hypothetical protein
MVRAQKCVARRPSLSRKGRCLGGHSAFFISADGRSGRLVQRTAGCVKPARWCVGDTVGDEEEVTVGCWSCNMVHRTKGTIVLHFRHMKFRQCANATQAQRLLLIRHTDLNGGESCEETHPSAIRGCCCPGVVVWLCCNRGGLSGVLPHQFSSRPSRELKRGAARPSRTQGATRTSPSTFAGKARLSTWCSVPLSVLSVNLVCVCADGRVDCNLDDSVPRCGR